MPSQIDLPFSDIFLCRIFTKMGLTNDGKNVIHLWKTLNLHKKKKRKKKRNQLHRGFCKFHLPLLHFLPFTKKIGGMRIRERSQPNIFYKMQHALLVSINDGLAKSWENGAAFSKFPVGEDSYMHNTVDNESNNSFWVLTVSKSRWPSALYTFSHSVAPTIIQDSYYYLSYHV